jgi:hypothetical protein
MIDTGKYLPLRFFDSLEEMSLNRRECSGYEYTDVAVFNTPNGYILPFQVGRITGSKLVIKLVDVCTEQEYTINDLTIASDTIISGETIGIYRTHLGGLTSTVYPNGTYYIKINTQYYSDIFNVKDVTEMTELKWRNTQGVLGDILWKPGFYGQAWVDSVIDKPTYPITEETREDQEGDIHKTFQRWEKRQSIRTMGVESVADALSLLPVMEEVYVDGTRVYDVVVDISWEEDYDCLARIDISFMRKKILKTF